MRKFSLVVLLFLVGLLKPVYDGLATRSYFQKLGVEYANPFAFSVSEIFMALVAMGVLMFLCDIRCKAAGEHDDKRWSVLFGTIITGTFLLVLTDALYSFALALLPGGMTVTGSLSGTWALMFHHIKIFSLMTLPVALFGHHLWRWQDAEERRPELLPS